MRELIEQLFLAYGRHDAVASAIGYTDRQYRNIRRKVQNGEAVSPRIAKLMRMKLEQIRGGCLNGDDDD